MKSLRNKVYHLLRKSEGLFKTNMVYLVKGGFWLSLGQAFNSVSAFILAVAFANYLSKESFGIYKYVLNIIGILSIANLRNINIAITQSVAQGNEGTARVGIKEKMKWGLLGSFGALLASSYYFLNNNYLIGTLLLISIPFLPIKDAFGTYTAILNGKKDFRRISIYGLVPAILNTIGTVAIIYFTESLYYLLIFYFAFWTITNFVLLKTTLSVYKLNNLVDENSLNYGRHASLSGIFNTVAGYFDKLVIFHYLGAVSTAMYTIALAPVSQINGAVGHINTLAVPKFSNQTTENLKFSLKNKERKIIIITVILAVIYIIMAPKLFLWFFPKYMDTVLISRVLALSIPLTIISRFRFTAIQSRFNKKIFNIYTWSMSSTQIILNFLGVYFYDLLGIAFSYIIFTVCQFIATYILVKKL